MRRSRLGRDRANKALRVTLAGALLLGWVPAWHAAFGSGTAKSPKLTSPFLSLGSMNGRQLVVDLRNGRRLVVPAATPVAGHVPTTPEAQAALAGQLPTLPAPFKPGTPAKVGRNATPANPLLEPRTAAPAAARDATQPAATDHADPWDPNLAGTRQSSFYPPARTAHGPGTITTVLGGRCDGLPGLQASVSPGNVVVDHAGRIFWVDVGSDLHAQSGVYIDTLNPDGTVRTLGNLNGPVEGRLFRGWASLESTNVRIVPDQKGGVFYTFNRYVDDGIPSGPDWQARDTPSGAPSIGRLRADGSNQFVSGVLGLPANRNDGGPVSLAAYDNIAAMAADADGNLYVADSSSLYAADSSGSPVGGGATDGPRSNRFGTDQPGYVAGTRIRFLNLSARAKTFYAGTGNEMTVAAGTVATIAGDSSVPSYTDPTFGTTPSPAPGDAAVTAAAARIPFIAGMVAGPNGVTLLASSETYLGTGAVFPTVWVVTGSSVYFLGLNTGSGAQRMSGTTVAPGTIATLGGGNPGYAGDGGPLAKAQFNVRDHDGWFYGDLSPDGHGGLLVADSYNNAIRDISAAGTVRTVAGGSGRTFTDGLSYPMGVAASPRGLIVSDWGASRIVEFDPSGHAHLLVGNGQAAYCGLGSAAAGDISRPSDLTGGALARNRAYLTGADLGDAVDAVTDSHGVTYAAIPNYGVVVRIGVDGTVTIAVGTPRSCVAAPPLYLGLSLDCQPPASGAGDGGRPQDAVLEDPENLLLDQYDNLYISDGDAVRYVNFSGRTLRPQGVTVRPGTIGSVYHHPALRLHLPLYPIVGGCEDFCNSYLDIVVGLGAMTLDPRRGTLFVVDLLDEQVLAVTYCGQDYLAAGRAHTLVTQISGLLGTQPPIAAPFYDGAPAYNVDIAPWALAFDKRRDLLLMTDAFTTTGSGTSSGRVLAVNVGTRAVDLWGDSLVPRTITTYAGGSGCTTDVICSYGDGSHAHEAAFSFPFGLAAGPDGSVFVAEATNRIRRIGSDGLVGTIAGNSRDMYDLYGFGSASQSWWYNGGECADGGAATTACFSGLHSLQLDPAGDLVVTDELSGRVRRITQAMTAPLRADAAPVRGAGWGFTPAVRLPSLGQEATDPSLAVDSQGNVYAMAPMGLANQSLSRAFGFFFGALRSMPCAIWSYALDADSHGHDAPTYLGEPDATWAQSQSTRTCSLAASPPGSTVLAPPTGNDDRLLFGSGSERPGFPSSIVVAGASRDGAHSFVSSPDAAVTTTAMDDLDTPSVAAIDGDTSGMVLQDSGDSDVDWALSRGGTQYVQLTRVATTGLRDYVSPTRFTSRPVMQGSSGLVPAFATVLSCQPLPGEVAYTCANGQFNTSSTTIETVATTNRGLSWANPSAITTLPCRRNGWFADDAFCLGYRGAPQLAVDASGTAYMVWDDGSHVVITHSTDHGATWSEPTQVDAGVHVAAYPAIVAGDNGRVGVAFYGSTGIGRDIGTPDHQWWVYLATSTDAAASHPVFHQSVVSNLEVHDGTLCQTGGTVCGFSGAPGPADAGSGIQLAMDPKTGHAIVAYSESRGVRDDGSAAGILMSRQCTGPSLLVHVTARPCSVVPETAGTGPVRCAPQGSDPDGDAHWSGAEQSGLDLRRLGIQVAGGTLTAAVDVSAFTAVPPVGASGAGWTVNWTSRGVRYFIRARSPSAGDPTAPSTDPSAPTLSYQWGTAGGAGGEVVAGSATGRVSGNTVVLSVPAGDVGDPQPGTRLSDLAAHTEVLTGGVPDGPSGTWTVVDRMATRIGYDAGLHCAAIGGAPLVPPVPTPNRRVPALEAGHPAIGARQVDPTPTPTIDPLPTVPVTPPPILVPDPPVIPGCGVVPPPLPVPPPAPVPAPHHPRPRALVPPPVVPPFRLNDGAVPDRAVAAVQPPPQAQAEAQAPAAQPLSQAVGAGAPQDEPEPATGLALERGWSPNDQAAWMLATATLTMASGAALALRRRRQGQYGLEK